MKQRLVPIMSITLSFLLLMFAVPPFVNSAEISGKITDKTDGSGLVHAIVSIIPENSIKALHSVAADESGNYKLGDIPAGSYQFKLYFCLSIPFTGKISGCSGCCFAVTIGRD